MDQAILRLYGDMVSVSVVLSVVSQLPTSWRNDSGSTGILKAFK